MVDPYAMLRAIELSPGQLAQLRAIDRKYQQRLYELLHQDAGARRGERELTEAEVLDLEAMVRSDILDMLTPEQLTVIRGRERP